MPYHGGSALDGHAAPLSHSLEAVESLAAGLSFYEDCCLSNSRNPVPWLAKNVLIYSRNNNKNNNKIIIIYIYIYYVYHDISYIHIYSIVNIYSIFRYTFVLVITVI